MRNSIYFSSHMNSLHFQWHISLENIRNLTISCYLIMAASEYYKDKKIKDVGNQLKAIKTFLCYSFNNYKLTLNLHPWVYCCWELPRTQLFVLFYLIPFHLPQCLQLPGSVTPITNAHLSFGTWKYNIRLFWFKE